MREEGLLKLFFAGALPPAEAVGILASMREHRLGLAQRLRRMEPEALAKEDPFPLMVLRAGIEFNEWFADWCERMERQLLDPAHREKEQLMFDALARFADRRARRIGDPRAALFHPRRGAWRRGRQPPRPLRRR